MAPPKYAPGRNNRAYNALAWITVTNTVLTESAIVVIIIVVMIVEWY